MSIPSEKVMVPPAAAARNSRISGFIAGLLRWLCSVRLGVFLLCVLGLACLIGMLVMQQNVDGFENYYAALTPAQKLVYGKLGFFNIYHAWYFNALLALLSLNIVLASVDRFPKTWRFFSKPQVFVPVRWLMDQTNTARFASARGAQELAAEAQELVRSRGWKRVRTGERAGREFIFAESGAWNRLGAYAVHVGLLTIFLGGFLTSQYGTTGSLPLAPGESSDLIRETVVDLDRVQEITKRLPFEVTFTDIEQKLIKREGPLTAGNTIDWITRFTIRDETGTTDALVQMNRPYDYRGYRFFQSSFVPTGRARSVTLDLRRAEGDTQRVTIPRDGEIALQDGTRVRLAEFRANFRMGPEGQNEDTSDYPNPGAVLHVTPLGGNFETAYAFGPLMKDIPAAKKAVAGFTYELVDFERVSDRHILSVQRDPGAAVVYVGFALLCVTLGAVFLFSHQRVWVVIETLADGSSMIYAAGQTNRNPASFEEKFTGFAAALSSAADPPGHL